MKYKLAIAFIFCLNVGFSQTRIGVGILGSNSLGLSVNAEQVFSLSDNHKLSVMGGIGGKIEGDPELYWLYKAGTYYYHGAWGIGTEFSVFNKFNDPSLNAYTQADLLIYPNINYTWFLKDNRFFKLSVGMRFQHYNVINPDMNPDLNHDPFWDSTPIFGLVFGGQFKNRK